MADGILFRKLYKMFKFLNFNNINNEMVNRKYENQKENIPSFIKNIEQKLKADFTECEDFVIREIEIGKKAKRKIIVAYIEGLVTKDTLDKSIIKPLILETKTSLSEDEIMGKSIIDGIVKKVIYTSNLEVINNFEDAIKGILTGMAIIFVDGQTSAIKASIQGIDRRNITEPDIEVTVRGPREGFIESLHINVALLRHKIKNPKFKLETMSIGKQTNTTIGICYIKGIVNENILNTVKDRLNKINVDAILDSGYIEQYIEDRPFSLFATIGNSEKPDKVASKILEGRIAIIIDGAPNILTVPNLFIENFQTAEDYYSRSYFASVNRMLRLLALLMSTILPAFYVAVVVFHFDVIPIKLLLTVSATRTSLPFSPFVEALFMMIVFELLREAGVRMPVAIGQTISIVGGLVIGQAAVSAKIVSPIMVIVIALTGITNFIIPSLSDTLPIIRFLLLIAAQIFGFLGILVVYVLVLIHLCSLESFGVPYMYPLSPSDKNGLKDSFIRFPLWTMKIRPKDFTWQNWDKNKYRMKGYNHVTKEDK